MKIALFQGLTFHYEILGYAIDFCKTYQYDFTIYSPMSEEWRDFYQYMFGELKWISNINEFNPDNYDQIVVLTDDDRAFKAEWHSMKCLRIDHAAGIIRTPTIPKGVAIRPNPNMPDLLWALPCYRIIVADEKQRLIRDQPRINVVSIGMNVPTEEQLMEIFQNFEDINFHIVARSIPDKYTKPNIFTYENASVTVMMNLLCVSDYVFCALIHFRELYVDLCMNGSIPMAFSTGCRLLLPRVLEGGYGFKTPLYYDDDEGVCNNPIIIEKNDMVAEVLEENERMICRRNSLFDYALRTAPPPPPPPSQSQPLVN